MKKLLMVSVFLFTVVLLQGCASSNVYEYIIDDTYTEFITMGTSADYPPYEWPMDVDGEQTIVGIDIEIAKAIADALGKNLKVVNKGFDFLLDDLESGKVDFVIAGMTPTDERAEVVDFSMVYYEATQVILIDEDDMDTYTSIESLDVDTVKVGAQLGSIQQDLATDTFSAVQTQFIQTIPDLVMNLVNGQLDAVIMEKPVADGYVLNQDGLAIANITIGDPDGGSAVAVQKGDTELLAAINAVLQNLINSKEMDQIVADAILLNS